MHIYTYSFVHVNLILPNIIKDTLLLKKVTLVLSCSDISEHDKAYFNHAKTKPVATEIGAGETKAAHLCELL
jgi:hypothetical protein